MNNSIPSLKAAMRKEILRARLAMPEATVKAYSQQITHRVLEHPLFKAAQCLMVYQDYKNEVQTQALIDHALDQGKIVVLPVVSQDRQTLHLVRYEGPQTPMIQSHYGIWEPMVTESNQVSREEIDLILAPGVAFDLKGYRMGYGGGYYDKLLAGQNPRTTKVFALCFELQIVEAVPHEHFDMTIDGFFTEARTHVTPEKL